MNNKLNALIHNPISKYLIISVIFILTGTNLYSQISRENEIKIVNDILPEIWGEELNCLYLHEKNGFSLLTKDDFDRYIHTLDTITGHKIAAELLQKATAHPDKNGVWHENEIDNAMLLTETEIYGKILNPLHIDSLPVRISIEPDCETFEVLQDSTNIRTIEDPLTGNIDVDTLDYYYPIMLVPEEFYNVYFISKPVIDHTGKYAILTIGTNPFTLVGQGCSLLCENKNGTWRIVVDFNCFSS